MNKICLLVFSGLLLLAMAGCGTIKGIGQDIGTLGHWLTRGSDTVKTAPAK
jgi:predicted small secreted protein